MPFRNIFIANPCFISLKNNQIAIKQNDINTFNPEDISCLVFESRDITITSAALSKLCEYGVTTFFCDSRHMPNGVLTPFCSHSRHTKALKSQISMTESLKAELWQCIIKNKLSNQASVLKMLKKSGYDYIIDLVQQVKLADTSHTEANAASIYFVNLFGQGFSRGQDNFINAALNYGYSLLRGIIARHIVAYGYEPSLGIFHKSELNNFNLADDLIEPFRPFVDIVVYCLNEENKTEFQSEDKKKMFAALNFLISVDDKKYNVFNATEAYVLGLNKSITRNCVNMSFVQVLPPEHYRFI